MKTQLHLDPNNDHSDNHRQSFFKNAIDFTFLPENSLYDTVIGSPLKATRQSTDETDASEINPVATKTYSRYSQQQQSQVYRFQDLSVPNGLNTMRSHSFQNSNHKFPIHFSQIPPQQMCLYTDGNPPDLKLSQIQSTQVPLLSQHMVPHYHYTQQVENIPQMKGLEGEIDEESSEEVDNLQLKYLIDLKIWSGEKDELLLKLGTQYKFDWKKIAKKFNNKKVTPLFLKIRHKELTYAPTQRRMKFNHKEDLMIAKYFEKYGSNWAQMSLHFENRTAIMLKNRYYSFIRKRDLLPILLAEVRDIEKENRDVDRLGVKEAEKHASSLVLKMAYEQNGHNFCRKMDQVYLNNIYLNGAEMSTHLNESELNNGQNEKQRKELKILKAKIKSLQSLLVITKTELDQLKIQGSN